MPRCAPGAAGCARVCRDLLNVLRRIGTKTGREPPARVPPPLLVTGRPGAQSGQMALAVGNCFARSWPRLPPFVPPGNSPCTQLLAAARPGADTQECNFKHMKAKRAIKKGLIKAESFASPLPCFPPTVPPAHPAAQAPRSTMNYFILKR